MACSIVFTVHPDDLHSNRPSRAVARCEIHDILVTDYNTSVDGLCPIGKIEAATAKAIKDIEQRIAALGD